MPNPHANENASQKAIRESLNDILDDWVAVKAAYVADPTDANYAARKAIQGQLSNARDVYRNNRPPIEPEPARFAASDAEAFLPEDQGGNTTRALSLLTQLFAERGDTDDPATVLAEMRAQIISTRSI